MRTQDQIVERIAGLSGNDFFGAQRGDLVDFLDFEHAKPFLKEGVTEAQWTDDGKKDRTPTLENIKAEVVEYMPFAWGKANDKRGLSAERSIDHMTAYVWLTADEDFIEAFERTEYEHYGKEKLIVVCKYFGIDYSEMDDGVRENS